MKENGTKYKADLMGVFLPNRESDSIGYKLKLARVLKAFGLADNKIFSYKTNNDRQEYLITFYVRGEKQSDDNVKVFSLHKKNNENGKGATFFTLNALKALYPNGESEFKYSDYPSKLLILSKTDPSDRGKDPEKELAIIDISLDDVHVLGLV